MAISPNSIHPKVKRSIELAMKEFEAGVNTLDSLLEQYHTLLEFKLICEQQTIEKNKTFARIEKLTALELSTHLH